MNRPHIASYPVGVLTVHGIIPYQRRVLAVKLNGNIDQRYIRVELINFASSVLAVDPNAPENNSVSKPRLVL